MPSLAIRQIPIADKGTEVERLVRQRVGQSHSIQDFLCENILKPLHMGWTHFKAIILITDPQTHQLHRRKASITPCTQ